MGSTSILAEELPEDEAETLLSLLEGALSQSQSVLDLESLIQLGDERGVPILQTAQRPN